MPQAPKEPEALWSTLAGNDARAAYQALWQLIAAPHASVALLDQRLTKLPTPDLKLIDRLIKDLNSESYSVRVGASAHLQKIGLPARPALENVLDDPPSSEVYLRAKHLLTKMSWLALTPKEVQIWRALEALEHIGTPAARQVLQRLAKGHPHVWVTRQAQLSLQRLQRSTPVVVLAKEIKQIALFEGHTSRVYGLAFSPDGRLLASAGADGSVRLWDTAKGEQAFTLPQPSGVWAVAFTPDGKLLATACSDHTLRIWEVAARKQIHTLQGHDGIVYSVAISADGQFLASGGSDRTVRLWEVSSGKALGILTGHEATVWGVAFSPDGKTLVSSSSDKSVKVWETVTGKERATLEGHASFVRAASITASGRSVVSCDSTGTCLAWDLASGKKKFAVQAHPVGIRHLTCSPVNAWCATAGEEGEVKLWTSATGKELATIAAHSDKARCVAFHPDGQVLATGSYDKTIKLWRLAAE